MGPLRYRTSPHAPDAFCHYKYRTGWMRRHGPLYDTERLPMPPCLLPLQLPSTVEWTRTLYDPQNASPCPVACCLYSCRTGWDGLDHSSIQNAPPVPVAITAPNRVGWTWDHSTEERVSPCPVPVAIQLRTGWMD
ncbi:hypothetical protein AVEN_263148-1 [Araneus ventricosus]|uniref:Uncharacterized protein n=1 Tax=Araneus ventricosus TaxID=182803 RepID=A0A4Y2FD43_ARAVE|nr:hypothetical protein AVEN_263148-1 [Araneus ventricosus]